MPRCALAVMIMWGCVGGPVVAGTGSASELEQQLLTHLNEQMYNSVRSVVLLRETDDGYEGFVRFANGRRRDVRVTVTDEKIEYKFIGRARADAADRPAPDANAPAAPPTVPVATNQEPVYTQRMYARIEKGMSYAQVAGIVGDRGSRISSSYFDGAVNEVWIWANSDDSHLCVVFRDGAVLVRTQSALPQVSGEVEPQQTEAGDFQNWLLATRIDGRIVPLDLSFGRWLTLVREAAAKNSYAPRIDVVEEDNRITVELSCGDAEPPVYETHLYLTCLSVQELGPDSPEAVTAERVCVPTGIQTNGVRNEDAKRAWEAMAALANLSGR